MRTSSITALQYRSNFVFGTLTALFNDGMRIAPLLLVYWHRDSVAGWDLPHALLVMALFFAMFAIQSALFEPNLGDAVSSIRSGTLDLMLMKPVDAQLLVSLRKVDPPSLWPLLSAILLGIFALQLGGWPTPGEAVLAAVLFGMGVASMYCLWLLATCVSFWFVRVDNLRILLWSITDAGRWPIDVFSGPARWLLTAVVPVALITSFPAEVLRGLWTWETVATAAGVTTFFVVFSRFVWSRSIAAYTSASS